MLRDEFAGMLIHERVLATLFVRVPWIGAARLRHPSVVVVKPAQHRDGPDAPVGIAMASVSPLVRDPLPDALVRSASVEVLHPAE
jgi:hypothetical protein